MFEILGDSKLTIHHSGSIHVYAATREQLTLLSQKAQSEWSVYYPPAFSITITCLINCVMSLNDIKSNVFVGNLIVCLSSFIVGFVFFVFAKREQTENKSLLNEILSQPIQVAADDEKHEVKNWTDQKGTSLN